MAGVDEAGRGPLAGPVVAAAAILTPLQEEDLKSLGLTDSKKLTTRQRERLFCRMNVLGVCWRAQAASAARIDRMNILRATLWAMARCVSRLPLPFDLLIVDGTFPVPGINCTQRALPRADSLVPSVSAASIAAKVLRDRIMNRCGEMFPLYGFSQHRGYPTIDHRRALSEHGPCPLHRTSFKWSAPHDP
ncbi:MAG: ribonuclease HII [Synergistaceae bacterium]|nr:ribonuclease HII [Synergistaceae bacterium]